MLSMPILPLVTGSRLCIPAVLLSLIFSTGCGGPEPPEGRFRLAAIGWDEPALLQMLTVEVTAAGQPAMRWAGSDFADDGSYSRRHTPWMRVPGRGEISVAFSVTDGDAMLAEGRVRLPLRPDWERELQLHIAVADPVETCFGCEGSIRFDIAGAGGRSLYAVWGGNSISAPVVY